jgi:XTP/dITP diphosphohydrolase
MIKLIKMEQINMRILVASNNPGKLVEIQALLTPASGLSGVHLLLPRDLGLALEVVEDGQTYADNAALKARAFFQAAKGLAGDPIGVLADDSGLEVDALGGQPGLHSARYSLKPGATDADRRAFLLENLAGKPRPWRAHFHCTVALVSPHGQLSFAEGDCPGEIIPEERGSNGFGYDPIFLLPELGRTMAELSMDEKNQLSHRARAVKAALPALRQWLA